MFEEEVSRKFSTKESDRLRSELAEMGQRKDTRYCVVVVEKIMTKFALI